MREIDGYHEGSLRDYGAVLRRQKLIFLLVVVLVPAVALGLAFSQTKSYQATAEALLGSGDNLAGITNGVPTASSDADRFAQTEVNVARIPLVASRTLGAAGVRGRTAEAFLEQSDVVAKGNANVLVFLVTDSNPALARRLVNAYVHQFTAYQQQLDSAPLTDALREVRSKIAELEGGTTANPLLLSALRSKESQLETAQQVQGSSVSVLQLASSASQVSPRPTLYAVLGLILGLVLATGAAVLRDSLDARVRSPEEIAEELGFPILGLVPGPSRASGWEKPVMISNPAGAAADAVRMLKTRLTLANLSHDARVIMFTSAVEDDGKLGVVANLALAFARGNRRVIVVDFDLRQPSLLRVLGNSAPRGVADLVTGAASVRDALVRVRIAEDDLKSADGELTEDRPSVAKNGHVSLADPDGQGELQLLATGSIAPNVWEIAEMAMIPKIFQDLRRRSDLVLVNVPPLLSVSDGMTLAAMVDAIVVVASARTARRPDLAELQEALVTLPQEILGIVLTDVNWKLHSYESLGGYELEILLEPAALPTSKPASAPVKSKVVSGSARARRPRAEPGPNLGSVNKPALADEAPLPDRRA